MSDADELTLTIHGLDVFNRDVDGELFARKFFKFMQGIAEADTAANGKRRHKFLISDLKKNTATASVREQVVTGTEQTKSSFDFFEDGLSAIYEDAPRARSLPRAFVKYVLDINKDVGQDFAKGEIKRKSTGKVIYIDEFLEARARKVLADINRSTTGAIPFYKGVAYGAFDGELRILDSLGGHEKAVLVLTAGGSQINCSISGASDDELRLAWKRRCIVNGLAHYDGESGLPVRLDIRSIQPLDQNAPAIKDWRGAFDIPAPDDNNWN